MVQFYLEKEHKRQAALERLAKVKRGGGGGEEGLDEKMYGVGGW